MMEHCFDEYHNCHKLLESCTSERPLQKAYMAENCRKTCGFCYPESSGCIDVPRNIQTQERWTDVNGMSCLEYKYLGWCATLENSTDGRGQLMTDRDIGIYVKDGLIATDACCVCGGGREAQCPNEYDPVCVGELDVGVPSVCYANLTEFSSVADGVVRGGRCLLEDQFYEVIIGQSCEDSLYRTCRTVPDFDECERAAEALKRDITRSVDVIAPPGCIMYALEDWAVVWNDASAYAPATTVFPHICVCGAPCQCTWSDFPSNLGSGCCPVWQVSIVLVVFIFLFILVLVLCFRMICRSSRSHSKLNDDDGMNEKWGPAPVKKGQSGYPTYGSNTFFRRGYCCDCYTRTCLCFPKRQRTLPPITKGKRVELTVTDGKERYNINVSWYYTTFGVLEKICQRSGSRRDPTSLELYDYRNWYLHPSTSVKRFGATRHVFVKKKPSFFCCFISCDYFFGSQEKQDAVNDKRDQKSELGLIPKTQNRQHVEKIYSYAQKNSGKMGKTSVVHQVKFQKAQELPITGGMSLQPARRIDEPVITGGFNIHGHTDAVQMQHQPISNSGSMYGYAPGPRLYNSRTGSNIHEYANTARVYRR